MSISVSIGSSYEDLRKLRLTTNILQTYKLQMEKEYYLSNIDVSEQITDLNNLIAWYKNIVSIMETGSLPQEAVAAS